MRPNTQERRALEIANEIIRLTAELNGLLIHSNNDDTGSVEVAEEETSSVRHGIRVRITNGTHKSKRGIITGRRGSQFWWIRLDNGVMVYKMAHNFTTIGN